LKDEIQEWKHIRVGSGRRGRAERSGLSSDAVIQNPFFLGIEFAFML
jgi:hypothetical protein